MAKMSDEVTHILESKGVTETRAVPPKIALPVFEDSSLEEDPNIQHLWNHLLANPVEKFNALSLAEKSFRKTEHRPIKLKFV